MGVGGEVGGSMRWRCMGVMGGGWGWGGGGERGRRNR